MKARRISLILILIMIGLLVTSCAPEEAPAAEEEPEAEEAEAEEAEAEEAEAEEAEEAEEEALPPAPDFIEIGASIPMTGK